MYTVRKVGGVRAETRIRMSLLIPKSVLTDGGAYSNARNNPGT